VCALGLFSAPAAASVTDVYGQSVSRELRTGQSRSVGDGLSFADGASDEDWNDVTLSWDITPIVGGFHYSYTIDGFNKPWVSHISLDLSDNAIDFEDGGLADADALRNLKFSYGSTDVTGEIKLEYGQLANEDVAGGVKFDELPDVERFGGEDEGEGEGEGDGEEDGVEDRDLQASTITISFDSNRSPVWHDIEFEQGQAGKGKGWGKGRGKGASGTLLQNTGIGDAVGDELAYVASPNGEVPAGRIPSPSAATTALILLATGLLPRRRRRA
jgi:hypothetical protein